MSNPWNSIKLTDYESHMSLDSVGQLQSLNRMMAAQFEDFPVKTAVVLGVAGGNGLEGAGTAVVDYFGLNDLCVGPDRRGQCK